MRVALVHDWLVADRGGEHVLRALAALFPDATIHTLVCDRARIHPDLAERTIETSPLQRLPDAARTFRRALPLFAWAMRRFDLSAYDLVISTTHCVAHAVRTHARQRHLSYVHTPARYLDDHVREYLPRAGQPFAGLVHASLAPARAWDRRAARGPDVLLANSSAVAERIRARWGRHAAVVHPPVDVAFFTAAPPPSRGEGYLVLGPGAPYKRVDLAVRWATARGTPLTVVGEPPPALRALAGPTVTFAGVLSREALRARMAGARALLQPGEEDFGIAPVEALAAGCPLIAYARGGVLDVAIDGVTGRLFDAQSVEALDRAVRRFEADPPYGTTALQAVAAPFAPARFVRQVQRTVALLVEGGPSLVQPATLRHKDGAGC